MKIISKLLFCAGIISLFFISGCATTKAQSTQALTPVQIECKNTCTLMAGCAKSSGRNAFSEHDMLVCVRECSSTHPMLRKIVTMCSREYLSDRCDKSSMDAFFNSNLNALKKQR
jgi:hypothetical protein